MLSSNAKITAARQFLLLLSILMIPVSVSAAPLTSSGNGEVQVQVCRDESEDLAINSPDDGDTLRNRDAVLKVAVLNLSKAEIYVQDVLRSSLRLGETAVGFEYRLTLDPGRQAIKVVGYDLCGKEFHTATVTVDVSAPPEPKGGPTTGTKPDPPRAPEIVATPVIYHEAISEVVEKTEIDFGGSGQSGDPAPGGTVLKRLSEWLDLGPTFLDVGNFVRAVVAVTGACLVINAQIAWQLIGAQAGGLKGKGLKNPKGSKRRGAVVNKYPRLQLYLRITGVLMLLALFVV